MIEGDFYSYLSGSIPVMVYPHHLPEDASYPAVTYQVVSSRHGHTIAGAAGWRQIRVQVDCWGYDLEQMLGLAESIRTKLHGYIGQMGSSKIQFIQLSGQRDLHEKPEPGSDKWLYRRSTDYLIKVAEDIPTL